MAASVRRRRPYPERLSLAASGELRSQMLSDVTQMPDGAGGFQTGMRSVTQDYVPRRLRIGAGRGINTPGAVKSAGETSRDQFEPKSNSVRAPRRPYRA